MASIPTTPITANGLALHSVHCAPQLIPRLTPHPSPSPPFRHDHELPSNRPFIIEPKISHHFITFQAIDIQAEASHRMMARNDDHDEDDNYGGSSPTGVGSGFYWREYGGDEQQVEPVRAGLMLSHINVETSNHSPSVTVSIFGALAEVLSQTESNSVDQATTQSTTSTTTTTTTTTPPPTTTTEQVQDDIPPITTSRDSDSTLADGEINSTTQHNRLNESGTDTPDTESPVNTQNQSTSSSSPTSLSPSPTPLSSSTTPESTLLVNTTTITSSPDRSFAEEGNEKEQHDEEVVQSLNNVTVPVDIVTSPNPVVFRLQKENGQDVEGVTPITNPTNLETNGTEVSVNPVMDQRKLNESETIEVEEGKSAEVPLSPEINFRSITGSMGGHRNNLNIAEGDVSFDKNEMISLILQRMSKSRKFEEEEVEDKMENDEEAQFVTTETLIGDIRNSTERVLLTDEEKETEIVEVIVANVTDKVFEESSIRSIIPDYSFTASVTENSSMVLDDLNTTIAGLLEELSTTTARLLEDLSTTTELSDEVITTTDLSDQLITTTELSEEVIFTTVSLKAASKIEDTKDMTTEEIKDITTEVTGDITTEDTPIIKTSEIPVLINKPSEIVPETTEETLISILSKENATLNSSTSATPIETTPSSSLIQESTTNAIITAKSLSIGIASTVNPPGNKNNTSKATNKMRSSKKPRTGLSSPTQNTSVDENSSNEMRLFMQMVERIMSFFHVPVTTSRTGKSLNSNSGSQSLNEQKRANVSLKAIRTKITRRPLQLTTEDITKSGKETVIMAEVKENTTRFDETVNDHSNSSTAVKLIDGIITETPIQDMKTNRSIDLEEILSTTMSTNDSINSTSEISLATELVNKNNSTSNPSSIENQLKPISVSDLILSRSLETADQLEGSPQSVVNNENVIKTNVKETTTTTHPLTNAESKNNTPNTTEMETTTEEYKSRFGDNRMPILPLVLVSPTPTSSLPVTTEENKEEKQADSATSESTAPVTSTPPTTAQSISEPTNPKRDYVIYGVLPNNTVVKKYPEPEHEEDNQGIVIYGILPNNTMVRKFLNGTIVAAPRRSRVLITDIEPRALFNPRSEVYRQATTTSTERSNGVTPTTTTVFLPPNNPDYPTNLIPKLTETFEERNRTNKLTIYVGGGG